MAVFPQALLHLPQFFPQGRIFSPQGGIFVPEQFQFFVFRHATILATFAFSSNLHSPSE